VHRVNRRRQTQAGLDGLGRFKALVVGWVELFAKPIIRYPIERRLDRTGLAVGQPDDKLREIRDVLA
jgi:hypothetical protein